MRILGSIEPRSTPRLSLCFLEGLSYARILADLRGFRGGVFLHISSIKFAEQDFPGTIPAQWQRIRRAATDEHGRGTPGKAQSVPAVKPGPRHKSPCPFH